MVGEFEEKEPDEERERPSFGEDAREGGDGGDSGYKCHDRSSQAGQERDACGIEGETAESEEGSGNSPNPAEGVPHGEKDGNRGRGSIDPRGAAGSREKLASAQREHDQKKGDEFTHDGAPGLCPQSERSEELEARRSTEGEEMSEGW
jgi:hypothetical protein